MNLQAVRYWNKAASGRAEDARDAILSGFRSERAFDSAGKEDAKHLLLPFASTPHVVLDVGCGVGRLLKWVLPHCKEGIGIDISEQMLRRAQRRLADHKNVSLRRLPVNLCFPVRTESVDFAYFYHVSEHVEREDAFRMLLEIHRCLRPNGRALVQFSLITHPDNQREFRRWAKLGDPEGVRSRLYTEPEAAVILAMARLYPQIRLYIPGEFVAVTTKTFSNLLGQMPQVALPPGGDPRLPPHRSARRRQRG